MKDGRIEPSGHGGQRTCGQSFVVDLVTVIMLVVVVAVDLVESTRAVVEEEQGPQVGQPSDPGPMVGIEPSGQSMQRTCGQSFVVDLVISVIMLVVDSVGIGLVTVVLVGLVGGRQLQNGQPSIIVWLTPNAHLI